MRKKLDELQTTLPSPVQSPTFDAPSPSPDEKDFDLPDDNFYNMNGFSSYVDSGVPLPFDINDFTRESPPLSDSRVNVQSIQVIGTRNEESTGAPLNDFYKSLIPADPFSQPNSNSFTYRSNHNYGMPPPTLPMSYHHGNPTMNTYVPPPPPSPAQNVGFSAMGPPMPTPSDEYDPWTDMPWNSQVSFYL